MVIAEALKYRLNQGKRSNLYFYRDSKGNEVDLLLLNGSDIFPIEVKAGMTITRDYFKGLNHFVKIFSEHVPKGMGLLQKKPLTFYCIICEKPLTFYIKRLKSLLDV